MRGIRMSESEYLQTKKRVEDLKVKIALLRDEKNVLMDRIRWYEYSEKNNLKKDYTETLAFKLFGKRLKDLTKEERKEYNRICTRKSRGNYKK